MRELVIPCGLLAVMGSMLLPVPPTALDFLLVGNLVLALILFVSSLYISDSLKLSSLPSLLLIATLYRLGLNVATTRSILTHADAGAVVHAFGETVIAGNLVVGLVVFLIITLIQFIVIAKGAERVAEVAARFTLDALPGKQMSVDADVRAGLIDFETARKRRTELQTESRFFGALDGAMKFVKGDAIAGLCMVAVNIIGGLAVGVLMHGMGIGAALQTYTLLTVGDGLVSQIPALLNALAAGMVVTRVARGDDQSLAHEVLTQLGQVRSAKIIIGLLAGAIGIVPGMPALPFLTIAAMLLGAGLLSRPPVKAAANLAEQKFEPRIPALLAVELAASTAAQIRGSADLLSRVQEFRRRVHRTSGLVLPVPELETSEKLDSGYVILLRGIAVKKGTAQADGKATLDELFSELFRVVEHRVEELLDDVLTRRMLDSLETQAAELVSGVVPTIATVTQITELLRALVHEGVPVRNFDVIVQAVAEHGSKVSNERLLLEEVRVALRRVISDRLSNAEGKIDALVLAPVYDLALQRTERESKPLSVEVMTDIVGQVEHWREERSASATLVLACSKVSRRLLAECLSLRGVSLSVIAFEEVADAYELVPLGRVGPREEQAAQQVMEKLAA